jgi:hypothetical protein
MRQNHSLWISVSVDLLLFYNLWKIKGESCKHSKNANKIFLFKIYFCKTSEISNFDQNGDHLIQE